MKELLNTIAGKLSGICKSVFVAHAKACIIAGSVVVAGSAATVTTVEYVFIIIAAKCRYRHRRQK